MLTLKEPVVPSKWKAFQRTVIFNNEYPHPQSHNPLFSCYYLNIPPKVNFFHPKIKKVPYESESGSPIVSGVSPVEF
jgi:hypothetical protein